MDIIGNAQSINIDGKVSQVIGLVIEATGPNGSVGDLCEIHTTVGRTVRAEIVGFKDSRILLMPLDATYGIAPGCKVSRGFQKLEIPVGMQLLGRILDGLGNPIDGKGPINGDTIYPVYNNPPNPLIRERIFDQITTGIKSIDGLVPIGRGQRVGIFSGSGVGKSVMMGMIARNTDAQVNIIALIGERGREVREFVENNLGQEGMARTIFIVATSDQAPFIRVKAAMVATTIAEYFRDKGMDVMLMLDSLTRIAHAQREVGLAIGEAPTTKGYTPSVFAILPKLLERTGTNEKGSITALYNVLVDGDDFSDPIADTARGILDGHLVLSRKLATKGHYPPVDVLQSVSRLKNSITSKDYQLQMQIIIEMMAVYQDSEDLINIGAYKPGSNKKVDTAINHIENIETFLKQGSDETHTLHDIKTAIFTLSSDISST